MKPLIERIQSMLFNLPEKDIKLSHKLLEAREFKSLMEIIDSDIYLVRRNQGNENPNEDYLIDLEPLLELKNILTDYMSYLVLDDISDDLEYPYDDYD